MSAESREALFLEEEERRRRSRAKEMEARRHARMTRRGYACFAAVMVGVFAVLFAVVGLNVSTIQKGYRLRETERSIEEERQAQEKLRAEVARLESAARIERVAEGQLGMVRPAGSLVVRLKPEGGPQDGTAAGRAGGSTLEAAVPPGGAGTAQ